MWLTLVRFLNSHFFKLLVVKYYLKNIAIDLGATSVMLNTFCMLSKKKTPPVFLMDSVKLDRIPTNFK